MKKKSNAATAVHITAVWSYIYFHRYIKNFFTKYENIHSTVGFRFLYMSVWYRIEQRRELYWSFFHVDPVDRSIDAHDRILCTYSYVSGRLIQFMVGWKAYII